MTMLDVRVCDAEGVRSALAGDGEPFDWREGVCSPFFPPLHTERAFWRVRKLLDSGTVSGGQISQLEWAVFATKADLLRYLDEWYQLDKSHDSDSASPGLRDSLGELRVFIEALDDAGEYALVADEF